MAIADIDPSAAGKASGAARRRAMLAHADRVQLIDQAVANIDTQNIGTNMLQAAVNLVEASARGEIPTPETPLERKQLADAAKVVYFMARLQLGESTQNVAHATVEDARAKRAELEERMARLRDADPQGA